MDAKQIIHYALQLENSNRDRSYGKVVALLGDLGTSCITAEQLLTTDIVQVLYRLLKTCSDDGVKRTVKRLLSKWKRQYSQDMGLHAIKCTEDSKSAALSCSVSLIDGGAAGDGDDKAVSKQDVSHSGSTQSQTCEGAKATDPTGPSSLVRDGPSTSASALHALSEDCKPLTSTADDASTSSDDSSTLRPKCVGLLLGALCSEAPDGYEAAAELAGDIERHIHNLHRARWVKYKACVRSKVANLRNPKSGHLRQGLLSGSLSPEAFARMSAEEMAGTELRRLREEYSSRGLSERQLPRGPEGTPTRKIRCKRCAGSDCRVTQVSRGTLFLPAWVRRGGPDEDAMTFVTCSGCGEQWYHSGWVCL